MSCTYGQIDNKVEYDFWVWWMRKGHYGDERVLEWIQTPHFSFDGKGSAVASQNEDWVQLHNIISQQESKYRSSLYGQETVEFSCHILIWALWRQPEFWVWSHSLSTNDRLSFPFASHTTHGTLECVDETHMHICQHSDLIIREVFWWQPGLFPPLLPLFIVRH